MKLRNVPLRGLLKKSPIKTSYPTRDFSPEATKDTFAAKNIEKFIPSNTIAGVTSAIAGGGILKNVPRIFKVAKNYLTS